VVVVSIKAEEEIMGAENLIQSGLALKIPGQRERNFKLGMKAQAWLAKKHGTIKRVYGKLSGELDGNNQKIEAALNGDMTEVQLEALVDIVYAGLMRDAEKNKEPFEREDALNLIDDVGIEPFFALISGEAVKALPDSEGDDPTSGQTPTT
jgi:hypothetical protein